MLFAPATETRNDLANNQSSSAPPQAKDPSSTFTGGLRSDLSFSNKGAASIEWRSSHPGAAANTQATYGNQAVLRSLDSSARAAKQETPSDAPTAPTGATPIPMDAPGAGAAAKKTVTINHLKLAGSSNSIDSAITFANTKVYNQANVELKKDKDVTLDEPKSKAIVGADLILDEYTVGTKPTTEEQALLKENQAAGSVSVYYVKDFSSGKTTGEAFLPKWAVGVGVAVGNKGIDQTFAHELGHILLDSGSHTVPDDTYLMHESVGAAKVKLTDTQKTTIRGSSYAK
jgi:hypothetical protein